MKKLLAIGEALVDFIPFHDEIKVGESPIYEAITGGAPVNVCCAYAKLGGCASLVTQVGEDHFGDMIFKDLASFNVDTQYVSRTSKANTCLAFVALDDQGERSFTFYRGPSADMLLDPKYIQPEQFEDVHILHFCSVSLGDYPMGYAHERAIKFAKQKKTLISFDPNIRLNLWDDEEALRKIIWEYIPYTDILKLSSDELTFITGEYDITEALPRFFRSGVKIILYTKGEKGAEVYTKNTFAISEGLKVDAIDTTGAGDAFAGAFLFQLSCNDVTTENLSNLSRDELGEMLEFSNRYSAFSVQSSGATASYPTLDQMSGFLA